MAAIIDKFLDFMGVSQDAEVDEYEGNGLYGSFEEYEDTRESQVEDSYETKRFTRFASKKSDLDISSTPAKSGRLFGNRNSGFEFKQNEVKQPEAKKESREITKEEARKMVNVGTSGLRLVLCKPTEFDNCQGICSHLRAQMTIVLNLQYVANAADRKRIFDFVSGCCYALDGNIQKVAELIYVVAPCNVDVFAEVAEGEKDSSESYDYDNIF